MLLIDQECDKKDIVLCMLDDRLQIDETSFLQFAHSYFVVETMKRWL